MSKKNDPKNPSEETALVPQGQGGALSTADGPVFVTRRASLAEALASDADLVSAPAFLVLQEGDTVEGYFVRWGEVEYTSDGPDPMTGEYRRGPSVVLSHQLARNVMCEFNSAYDIDRALKAVEVGQYVTVTRGKTHPGKKQRTDYHVKRDEEWKRGVFGTRNPDGTPTRPAAKSTGAGS